MRFQTPKSVGLLALTEFQGESSVSSSQPIICVCVCQSELTEFSVELTEFGAELSEFSLPKQVDSSLSLVPQCCCGL